MRTLFRLTLLFITVLMFSSCTRNVSNDPNYPTDYITGATYRLKKCIYGTRDDPNSFGFQGPIILVTEKPGTKGAVQPGTLIKITELIFEKNPEMGNMIWVHGKASGIAWAPDSDVELWFISRKKKDEQHKVDLPMVNPEFLELARKP